MSVRVTPSTSGRFQHTFFYVRYQSLISSGKHVFFSSFFFQSFSFLFCKKIDCRRDWPAAFSCGLPRCVTYTRCCCFFFLLMFSLQYFNGGHQRVPAISPRREKKKTFLARSRDPSTFQLRNPCSGSREYTHTHDTFPQVNKSPTGPW